jgi:cholesterol transport system auxiliary component
MKTFAACCLLAGLLVLGGCIQLPDRSQAVRVVAPQSVLTADATWPVVPWSLAVQRPVTDQTRGSVRIVVRSPYSRLSFYPGVAWLDEMPDMLQTMLLQAFVDSNRITAVARPGTAQARYNLGAEVRRFDAVEGANGRLTVELELQAGLVEARTGRIIANRVFKFDAPVAGSGPDALTGAFETALGDLVNGVVGWTLNAVPNDSPL